MTTAKPLWRTFFEVTPDQQRAEMASDLARGQSGEMSVEEARERVDAWHQVAQEHLERANLFGDLAALACAGGSHHCLTSLVDHGMVIERSDAYILASDADLPSALARLIEGGK